jgi:hypothetical protein
MSQFKDKQNPRNSRQRWRRSVPIEAGIEATVIVRKYFTEALDIIAAGIVRAEELDIGLWRLHWNRDTRVWEDSPYEQQI